MARCSAAIAAQNRHLKPKENYPDRWDIRRKSTSLVICLAFLLRLN
jgi:hypothetical protein